MTPKPPDFVDFIILLVGWLVSQDVAATLGTYAAIFIMSITGAFISLEWNERDMDAKEAARYVTARAFLAIVITVPLAMGLTAVGPKWLYPNVSMCIVAVGIGFTKDFGVIRTWVNKKLGLVSKNG